MNTSLTGLGRSKTLPISHRAMDFKKKKKSWQTNPMNTGDLNDTEV